MIKAQARTSTVTGATPNDAVANAPTTTVRKLMTKKQRLIKMLSSRAGADVEAISKKLEWQAHTTRAALSGLRKAGIALVKEKAAGGKPTRYRIVPAPAPVATGASAQGPDGAGASADAG